VGPNRPVKTLPFGSVRISSRMPWRARAFDSRCPTVCGFGARNDAGTKRALGGGAVRAIPARGLHRLGLEPDDASR